MSKKRFAEIIGPYHRRLRWALLFSAAGWLLCAGESVAVDLSLAECLRRALKNNAEIRSQEIEWYVSKWNVRREWAQFEPVLAASARRDERSRENTVEETRNQLTNFFEERNDIYDLGIQGLFFSGAKYRVGYSVSDLRNNLTNVTFQQEFESQYRSFLGAEVSQPLLKGAWLSANMAGVRLASTQRDKAFHGVRRRMMDILAQAEAAYWDLVFAQQEYRLRAESVRNAGKVLEDNRARRAAGKMAEVEVLQAEAGFAERNTRKNETRRQMIQLMRRLNTLMAEPAAPGAGELVASDEPRLLQPDLDFEGALYAAAQLQPDSLIRERELRDADIRLKYAKTQRWPQIDLVGKYGYSGLDKDQDGSWDDISSQDYPDWTLGIQASVGLGGEQQGLGELRAAQLRKAQAALQMTNVNVEISNAIQASLLEIAAEKESIADCAKVAEVNRRLFEEELQKLDAGKSSSRQVLDVEQDMLEARVAETRGRNRYQRAALQLELAAGTILASRNLELIPTTFLIEAAPPSAPALRADEPVTIKPSDSAGEPVPVGVWRVQLGAEPAPEPEAAAPAPAETAAPRSADDLNQPVSR